MIAQAKEIGIYHDNEIDAHIVVVGENEYVCSSLENAVRFAVRHQTSGEIECDKTVDLLIVNTILKTIEQEQRQLSWSRQRVGYNRRGNGRFSHIDR